LKPLLLFLLVLCLAAIGMAAAAHLNFNPLPRDATADRVLVEKSARRLTLLRNGNAFKTYRMALGRAPIGAKGTKAISAPRKEFTRSISTNRTAITIWRCTSLIPSRATSIALPLKVSPPEATS
jgi:hypothetical protein